MEHRRIIKQGGVVVATHEDGSMDPSEPSSQGLFVTDTRFLSRFQLYLNGLKPRLLGSSEESIFEAGYLHTNPELTGIPARSLGVFQRNSIQEGIVKISLGVANWTPEQHKLELSIDIDADFYDSFEARGVKREKRGKTLEPSVTNNSVDLGYMGLDDAKRTTHIDTKPDFARYVDGRMAFSLVLQPNAVSMITLTLTCTTAEKEGFDRAYIPVNSGKLEPDWIHESTEFDIGNRIVDGLLRRSVEDIHILMTELPGVWVPAAGLPRFAVPFGRDSLFTSMETLSWNPRIAHDVLCFLAEVQGKEDNPFTYEQPGKILHELHTGELARLKEIPFGLFYGSVDATVLFLLVAAEYICWTGDLELYRDLKPNFAAAWKWIHEYGDIDGSGYIQYQAHTAPKMASAALTVGLFNQGWKDSANAVMYSDGTMVTDHPVALSEVQGYLYRALRRWGELYTAMPASEGMREEGERLLARAAAFKDRFNQEFWMPEKGYYAMALDGHHRQVDTITSNPGHCLWTGLVADEYAETMTKTLFSAPMSSSWGIRSMANNEKAYNPLSYHDGSVWPFENTLIGAGLKSYGFVHESDTLFDVMVQASSHFEYGRWPEVYSGVARDAIGVLAIQPDASRPQAWSAGAIFLWLQTWLGLTARPFSKHVDMRPSIPPFIDRISVSDLAIAGGHLSLTLVKADNGQVQLHVTDNPNELDITLHPVRHAVTA